ncbi:MAG: 30S ribosomal protein S6 [Patescibacteria group bacterium]|nr:30S ribosomal protein S6 [Patescibacteria group bacterium]
MKSYELTVLVRNEGDIEPVKKIVAGYKGEIVEETKWGKRELAYPIKKETEAFYFTYQLKLDPGIIADFKKKMNYEESIVRYLLLAKE